MDKHVPVVFPAELPNESSAQFWLDAMRLEMISRSALSDKVRSMIAASKFPEMTPIEAWFYRRRVEWAGQVALTKAQEGVEPDAPLEEVLEWALVRTWETDGCIALWNNMERDGKPHPEDPDGLSPI